MRLVYSTSINNNKLMVNVVELLEDSQYVFPIKNAYQSDLGAGAVDQFETKEIAFTYYGTDLVFKGANGWKVFLLSTYNHKYVPARTLKAGNSGSGSTSNDPVNDPDNFSMKPLFMTTRYVPAGLAACDSGSGQAYTFLNKLQAESCLSCSYIYQMARKREIAYIE